MNQRIARRNSLHLECFQANDWLVMFRSPCGTSRARTHSAARNLSRHPSSDEPPCNPANKFIPAEQNSHLASRIMEEMRFKRGGKVYPRAD